MKKSHRQNTVLGAVLGIVLEAVARAGIGALRGPLLGAVRREVLGAALARIRAVLGGVLVHLPVAGISLVTGDGSAPDPSEPATYRLA